jgi:hypothetical protein
MKFEYRWAEKLITPPIVNFRIKEFINIINIYQNFLN